MRGKGRPRRKLPILTLKAFYAQGATIAELAAAFGVSIPTVHVALLEAGAAIRGRGRRRPPPSLALPDGGRGLSAPAMNYYRRTSRGDFRRGG